MCTFLQIILFQEPVLLYQKKHVISIPLTKKFPGKYGCRKVHLLINCRQVTFPIRKLVAGELRILLMLAKFEEVIP